MYIHNKKKQCLEKNIYIIASNLYNTYIKVEKSLYM